MLGLTFLKDVLGANNTPLLGFLQVGIWLYHEFLIDVLGKARVLSLD
jgi:hypothetical protein